MLFSFQVFIIRNRYVEQESASDHTNSLHLCLHLASDSRLDQTRE